MVIFVLHPVLEGVVGHKTVVKGGISNAQIKDLRVYELREGSGRVIVFLGIKVTLRPCGRTVILSRERRGSGINGGNPLVGLYRGRRN